MLFLTIKIVITLLLLRWSYSFWSSRSGGVAEIELDKKTPTIEKAKSEVNQSNLIDPFG